MVDFLKKNEDPLNALHDVDVPADMSRELFEEKVDQDADAPIVGELTDAEILQATQQSKSTELEEDEEDEEDDEVPEEKWKKYGRALFESLRAKARKEDGSWFKNMWNGFYQY